jgi:hypothetical protein
MNLIGTFSGPCLAIINAKWLFSVLRAAHGVDDIMETVTVARTEIQQLFLGLSSCSSLQMASMVVFVPARNSR